MMNYNVYGYTIKIASITDGTSNTIMLAEGYCNCASTTSYPYYTPPTYTAGSYYKSSQTLQRVWNFDPFNYTSTSSYTGVEDFRTYPYTIQLTSTSSGTYAPYYSPYGTYNYTTSQYTPFAVKPTAANCDPYGAQASTSGGCIVCLADASVRIVNPSISIATWQAAGTINSGDLLGSDW